MVAVVGAVAIVVAKAAGLVGAIAVAMADSVRRGVHMGVEGTVGPVGAELEADGDYLFAEVAVDKCYELD